MDDNAKGVVATLGIIAVVLFVAFVVAVFRLPGIVQTQPPDPYHRELVMRITEAHVTEQGLPRDPSSRQSAAVDIVAFAKAIEEADE